MIFFNVKPVREFLLKNGYVYTIRDHMLKQDDIAVTGSYRSIKKLCDVKTEFVCFVSCPEDLAFYTHASGFATSVDWYYLAQKMRHKPMMLFKVSKC